MCGGGEVPVMHRVARRQALRVGELFACGLEFAEFEQAMTEMSANVGIIRCELRAMGEQGQGRTSVASRE